jgi:uncharacterized repeat protein (TIGR03803 family)
LISLKRFAKVASISGGTNLPLSKMRIFTSIFTGALLSLLGAMAHAQTVQFTTLTNLNGTNGSFPYAALTLAKSGNLYGAIYEGGSNNYGAIIEVTPAGTVLPFYSFNAAVSDGTHNTNSTGGFPYGGLILANDGNLYGPADNGGANGAGTIYKITNGTVVPFFNFGPAKNGTNATGATPEGKLALGPDGNFYGTAYTAGLYGRGAVFKLTTNAVFTKLIDFTGTNGNGPESGLTYGNDGNFYGVTYGGGTNNNGTVFKITTNGSFTSLYSFPTGGVTASFSYTNIGGANPAAALTAGPDGLLYGTTHSGGPYGAGTIFKITTNGLLTTLLQFNNTNGGGPLGEMILAGDGNFYGTTPAGGTNKTGAIFKLSSNGVFNLLFSFDPTVNSEHGLTNYTGSSPYAGLAVGSDGAFYGTATGAGPIGFGTVYRFSISSGSIPLSYHLSSTNIILTWSSAAFTLQSSPEVTGTYTNVPGATSPYTNPVAGNRKFFRLIGN